MMNVVNGSGDGTITRLLREAGGGDPRASEDLLDRIYDDLKRLAQIQVAHESPDQSFQPTVLVHEVFLRLLGADHAPCTFEDRRHFFAVAARAMRRILVERARRRLAEKRGGGRRPLDIAHLDVAATTPDEELVALHDAVDKLDEGRRRIVDLRFFAGLTMQETATTLGVSLRSLEREWTYIRARLYRELKA
jgi:RNA polymerase sigma factor (TIGR02999 family)